MRRWILAAGTVASAAMLALTACGSSSSPAATSAKAASGHAATGKVVARVGKLQIVDPFLPKPASPSVAAIYLTVRNTGDSADELVSVSSPVTPSSMLMTEDDHGSVGTMAPVANLVVPAHGDASLVPGRDHVMLNNPKGQLRVGQHVTITLRFQKAGSVKVSVPVVPLTDLVAPPGRDNGSSGTMKNMRGM